MAAQWLRPGTAHCAFMAVHARARLHQITARGTAFLGNYPQEDVKDFEVSFGPRCDAFGYFMVTFMTS